MKYIDKSFTENTGGGCWVDFLILNDGRCVGINDECLVLYPSYDAVYDGTAPLKVIDLLED